MLFSDSAARGELGGITTGDHPLVYWLAFGAAVSIVFSIAVSQILLAAGLAALLFGRIPLRFPPIRLPLFLFFAWTVAADLLSGDPWRGFPQLKKFFVFGIVLLVFNTFREQRQIRSLILAWAGAATISSLIALFQFARRWQEAVALHAQRYDYLLDGRIRGFAGHWMTFGGEEMMVLLMLVALLAFAAWPNTPLKTAAWCCVPVIWLALILGFTRSIFLLGLPAGIFVLVWNYRRWFTLAIPAAGVLMFLVAPAHVRERVVSVIRPHEEVDSNSRRSIMRRTGMRMIEAHPWFGLGPEQVGPQFKTYLPEDIALPLPKGWYGHLHNVYLQYAAERGVPALGFMLWLIGATAVRFAKAAADPALQSWRFLFLGALAVIAADLTEGLFEYNLGDSEVLTIFLIVITCGYCAIEAFTVSPPVFASKDLALIPAQGTRALSSQT